MSDYLECLRINVIPAIISHRTPKPELQPPPPPELPPDELPEVFSPVDGCVSVVLSGVVDIAGSAVAGVSVAGVPLSGVFVVGVFVAGVSAVGVSFAGVSFVGLSVAGVSVEGVPGADGSEVPEAIHSQP